MAVTVGMDFGERRRLPNLRLYFFVCNSGRACYTDFVMKMEFFSLIIVALISALVIALVLLVVAGVCSLCGAVSFGTVFVKGLWSMLLIPAVMIYGGLVERNLLTVKNVDVPSEKLPETFDGYRIVHISDLHLRSFRGRSGALKRAVEKINALEPDLICFSGDLVTMASAEIEPFQDILSSLKARDGVVSVMGNHDYCSYNPDESLDKDDEAAKVRSAERKMGWHLLDDANFSIVRGGRSLSVLGVQNISASRQFQSYGDLVKAMAGADGEYKILVSHDPTHWRQEVLGRQDVGLVLSGHTHAMQLSLFGWCPSRYMFREYRGLYSETTDFGTQYIYVNPGLGETIFPLRIGVVPEISLITLRSPVSEH